MITRFPAWLAGLVKKLATYADNETLSLRKILVLGVGTLGLAMGVAFIALSVAAFYRTGTFSPAEFGAGAVQIITALAALPLSLAKSLQWRPGAPETPPDGDPPQ